MLDLSCNRICTLPREFSTLTHLVKIDLSANSLSELPDNFGNLHNLQYLDLYSNQLVTLPVSFCRLKNLRWLDLKNNPLEGKLKTVAGDCLDEKECQACAKKVVSYMQAIDSDLEREKQKKLKAVREKESAKQALIDKELEEQRRSKKLEREKRKAESKAKREAQLLLEKEQQNDHGNASRINGYESENDMEQSSTKGKYLSFKAFLFFLLVICSSIFIYLLWSDNMKSVNMHNLRATSQYVLLKGKAHFLHGLKLTSYYSPIVKENLLKVVHYYMVSMTHFASQIEQMLSGYF
ncbi:leucine-rich repeat-containing protein 59 isoform X2 [Parasteatoda tepidariorum]|nr:leucine-rich repeat-containing protein 59 isoform X2 [Parasteatoda tepidariorum]XP_042898059.1 leucine-rich repeat-containing protein 59 isoform X2 [Parasteatoda tepidariorum]